MDEFTIVTAIGDNGEIAPQREDDSQYGGDEDPAGKKSCTILYALENEST